jgi:hypothetical protein
MKRGTDSLRRLAFVQVVLALLVQLAPSIHLLSSHRHEVASCTHGTPRIHFEAVSPGANDAPCPVCAQLLNRQAVADSVGIQSEIALTLTANLPSFAIHPGPSSLEHPDNRGPPQTL